MVSPLTSATDEQRWTRAAFVLITVIAIFRFWFAAQFELVGDEAYYWIWSQHPALSYFSKGPGVAWTIRLSTMLLGHTVIGVRAPAVLLAAGTGCILFALARSMFSARTGFWCVVWGGLVPLFLAGSVLMTIDALSVFFWALAVWVFWKIRYDLRVWPWLLLGLTIAAGALCKYTNLFGLVSVPLFCLLRPETRRHFARPGIWLMALVALLGLLPVILWNQQHHWVTLRHLGDMGGVGQPRRISLWPLLEFFGQQAAVSFPVLLALALTLPRHWLRRAAPVPVAFLLAMLAPQFLLYVLLALNKPGHANWTANCYVSGLVLAVGLWGLLARERAWARRSAGIALGLAVTAAVGFHLLVLFRLPVEHESFQRVSSSIGLRIQTDPLRRIRGSADLAQQVQALQAQTGARAIIADHYWYASLLTFYLPGHPRTFTPSSDKPNNQFYYWPGYLDGEGHEPALFLNEDPKVPEAIVRDFGRIEPMGSLWSRHRGLPEREFFVYLCSELRGVRPPSRPMEE